MCAKDLLAKLPIRLIFLLHFLFYAVTPLSYSYINNTSHDLCIRDYQTDNENLHLYIFDAICLQISKYSVKKHKDDSPQFILLKKKRAILPEEESEKALKIGGCIVIDNDSLFFDPPVQLSDAINKETLPSKSFRSSFSGLSPPIV